MTILTETFKNIAGQPATGTVEFVCTQIRQGSNGTSAITTSPTSVRLVNGVMTSPDLDPGAALVRLKIGEYDGGSVRIVIPVSAEPVQLFPLMSMYVEDVPAVVSQAWQAAWAAQASAERAEAAAASVDEVAADAAQVAADRIAVEGFKNTAVASATDAGTSATAAANSQSAASGSATSAGTSATAANTAKNDAQTAKTGAESARDAAATSAGTANTKATEASDSATAAAASETAAAGSATTASTKAGEASTSATAADTSADEAAGSAIAAAGSATAASYSAAEALGSSSNADSQASAAALSAAYAASAVELSADSAEAAQTAQVAAELARDQSQQGVVPDSAVTDQKVAANADIQQSKILNLVSNLADKLSKAGGDVTGSISSSVAPTDNTHLTRKDYVDSAISALVDLRILKTDIGAPNGVAPLDATGKLAPTFLPSYVDDVLEYASLATMPATGESGKIYTALDSNKIYRWSGSVYVEISSSPGSTDAVVEGAVNKYFTDARAQAAMSASMALKAPLASPAFTGSPTVNTKAIVLTDDTRLLGTNRVTATELADNAVDTAAILDSNVTLAKLAQAAKTGGFEFGHSFDTRKVGLGDGIAPLGYRFPMPFMVTKTTVEFSTADGTGSTIITPKKNGTDFATGATTVAAGSLTGSTSHSTSFAYGDKLTFNVTQIGGTPGKILKILVEGYAL